MQVLPSPTITSIGQMSLFLGIGMIIFGWMDKKEKLIYAGLSVFILLGLFNVWLLNAGGLEIPADGIITKETKLAGFCRGSIVLAALATVSFILLVLKIKYTKWSILPVILYALMLFFMVFSISQIPN